MSGSEALAIQSISARTGWPSFLRLHTILFRLSRGFNGALLSSHNAEVVQPNQTLTQHKEEGTK